MTISSFWDSTLKDVLLYIKAHTEQENRRFKERLNSDYNIATLTVTFICAVLNKKSIPSLEELYPSIFGTVRTEEEEEDYNRKLAKFQEEIFARKVELMNKNKRRELN